MSDTEVKNQINTVITEQVDKVSDIVNEKVIDVIGLDASIVEPIISEVTAAAATVVESGLKQVSEKLGIKMISESSLTDYQKQLANKVYESTKADIQSFVSDMSLNNTIKITKIISQLLKQLENISIEGNSPSGADKKAVALQIGRILIKEVTPDDKGEAEILMVYDLVAEPTLEAMIDVSRVLNTVIQETATKCCPGLLTLLKKK
jgi:hypothetical protein